MADDFSPNAYYVDCDFRNAKRRKTYTLPDGTITTVLVPHMRGCLPKREPKFGLSCPIFEEVFREDIIPRSDWKDEYEKKLAINPKGNPILKWWQYNQRNEGTCTSNASSGCLSYVWTEQFGRSLGIAPAPTSLYRYCASGPNSGSSCSCNLKRMRDNGCLLIDHAQNKKVLDGLGLNPDHVLPPTGWNSRMPSGAMEETAPEFKIDEFYEITSVDGFFTALLRDFEVLYGRSGHAIHGAGVVDRSNDWYCKYDNSWGDWGDQGFGYDSLDYIRRTSAPYGAFAIQSIRVPDNIGKLIGLSELS